MDTIKYIKKILFNFILLFLVMFIVQESVYAETNCDKYACAKCVYTSGDNWKIIYDISSDGNGILSIDFKNQNLGNFVAKNAISDKDYWKDFDNNKIVCKDVYLTFTQSGRELVYFIKSTGNSEQKMTLDSSSTNNNKPVVANTENYNTCDFNDSVTTKTNATCTVQSSNGKVIDVNCGGYKYNEIKSDIADIDFSQKCSQIKLHMYCDRNQGYCTLNKNANFGNDTTSGTDTGESIDITKVSCSYKGQISGKNLTITKKLNANQKWEINYPDGSKKELDYAGTNVFPTNQCEDIFLVKNNGNVKIVKIDADTIHTDSRISQLCNGYGNEVEQFCHDGNCKISNALCGTGIISDEDAEDGEGCPWQLRAVIVFLKKVAFNTVQLFVPIILIIMGTIDFVKAVSSSDDKGNKDAISKFIKRCLAALMVFFIGTIVSIVMNMFAKTDVGEKNDWKTCWQSIK